MDPGCATSVTADRNLLFGILALQMGFINRDGLIAGMNAWVLNKTKSLGQILADQGVLEPENHALLEVLIQRHLKMHGDDVAKSLASLSSLDSLRDDLQEVTDPEVQASLMHLSAGTPYDPYVTRASVVGQPSTAGSKMTQNSGAGSRFRILREHAKGGLGAVFVAEDEELHRQVALKEIQVKYAYHTESQARFLLEAEVTGGLEHPGIVPVYGLGRYPDGRPFYAMRFIKGDSLHEAIRRFYALDHEPHDPGERTLAFRELLGQFVATCKALAYAHSRGVLHRDVKPHNIMLGKYGETLVVDWGLAKVMGDPERVSKTGEGVLQLSGSCDSTPTQAGHVLGTPAYMSPEQAEGRLDLLGPASDIFSLGATLYELLTGQPPICGGPIGEVLSKIIHGDWQPPRKVRKDVPAPLDGICRKAMALRPENRYASALELAADVEHWLADEPVTAYREPWIRRLRRWLRRHQGLAAGMTALLVTAVVAAGLLATERQKRRQEWAQRTEALARSRTTTALQFLSTGAPESAETEHKEALALQQQLVAAFPATPGYRQELAASHYNLADVLKRTGRPKEAEAAYRDALALQRQLAADFPAVPGYRKDLAASCNNLGRLLAETGRPKEAEAAYREAITLQKALTAESSDEIGYRQDLAMSRNNLGLLLLDKGQVREVEGIFRDIVALYGQLMAEFPAVRSYRQNLAASENNLADLLRKTGRPAEAEKAYRDALAVQKKLVAEHPAVPSYRHELAISQSNLADLLQEAGKLQEAEAPLRQALALQQQLAAEFPTNPTHRHRLAIISNNLGILLKDTARPKAAEQANRDALAISKQLAAEFPSVPSYREVLARSQNNLGVLYAVTGRLQEAVDAYDAAVTLQKQLAAEFSDTPDRQNELANTMVNLAELYRDRKDFARARALLEDARPYHDAALKANPLNPTYRQFFRANRIVQASTLAGLDDHAGAGRTIEQLAALGWDPAADTYAAACGLAQCIPAVADDAQGAGANRQKLVQSYSDRALAMLQQAIRNGFKDIAFMKSDPSLKPLHSRPEFQKLLRETQATTKMDSP